MLVEQVVVLFEVRLHILPEKRYSSILHKIGIFLYFSLFSIYLNELTLLQAQYNVSEDLSLRFEPYLDYHPINADASYVIGLAIRF